MSRTLFTIAATLLLAGSAAAQAPAVSVTPSVSVTPAVSVTNAWARATPGQAEAGAAYLTIESPTGDRLTALSTPVANKAELHTMSMDGNIMRMRPLADIDVPAGKPVTLQPGGTHIMLMGLKAPLRVGQSFPLTLQFDKAGAQQVTVSVEKPGASGPETQGSGMKTPMPAGH